MTPMENDSPMAVLEDFVTNTINNNIWTVIPWLLIAAGLYFAVRTIVVQVRMLPEMFRAVMERPATQEENDAEGISSFKAFTISAASRVGTGNVAGVAVAITTGGPGAVFWMWIVAILGGATAFVEATLAQLWKVRDEDADAYRGGPAYYLTKGLNAPKLASIFAVAITITFGFVYNAIQANSIAESFATSVGNDTFLFKFMVGVVLVIITALIIFGGVQRIANVTQYLVPFMAVLYLVVGLFVVLINLNKVPGEAGVGANFGRVFRYVVGVLDHGVHYSVGRSDRRRGGERGVDDADRVGQPGGRLGHSLRYHYFVLPGV